RSEGVRINELCRELGVKAKHVIDYLPAIGITEKKTHSSWISEAAADKIRQYFRTLTQANSATADASATSPKHLSMPQVTPPISKPADLHSTRLAALGPRPSTAPLLAYVSGTVDQGLLLRNEYLTAENRILRGQIKGRLLLSEGEKATLAEIAHRLGRKALADVAATAKPETILGWYRKLIAKKFDGSKSRRSVGRPKVDQETERLIVQMARENPSCGYDRIVGALANFGHRLSDQTVGNIFRRQGISPAPKRKQSISWKNFIRAHRDVLVGMDFFTTEV